MDVELRNLSDFELLKLRTEFEWAKEVVSEIDKIIKDRFEHNLKVAAGLIDDE